MVVHNWVISIEHAPAGHATPQVGTYPSPGTQNAYLDTVVKVSFSKPVRGVDARSFVLTDSHGIQVPAWVDQIGDGTWGLFPNPVTLKAGETYAARLKAGICDFFNNCTKQDTVWKFKVSKDAGSAEGDTSIPVGFTLPNAAISPGIARRAETHNSRPVAQE
jgi:hypothetical protein